MIKVEVALRPVKEVKAGDIIYWIDEIPFKLEIIHSFQSSCQKVRE